MKQPIVLSVVALMIAGSAAAGDSRTYMRAAMSVFAGQWLTNMEAAAKSREIAIAPEFRELVKAVEADDYPAASNIFARLRDRIGQYAGSVSDQRVDNALWQYVLELYGAFEQFSQWEPALLRRYGEEILKVIPSNTNSVYFGGTDAGRFVITVLNARQNRICVLTQNALADGKYLEYIYGLYHDRIWLPGLAELEDAFQRFVSEVQSGKRNNADGLTIADGRVRVEGVETVMVLNGMIAEDIFNRNPNHDFFVQESYTIPWMYPYLEPCGPILKLNREPLKKLPPETVRRDRAYWDALSAALLADPAFLKNNPAREGFAKLRDAGAGVYLFRKMEAEAEHALRQAVALFPGIPESNFRLADLLQRQGYPEKARAVIEKFSGIAPGNARVRKRLQELERRFLSPEKTAAAEKLVKDLANPDAQVRKSSFEALQKLGVKVEAVLRRNRDSADPEIRAAVRELLKPLENTKLLGQEP